MALNFCVLAHSFRYYAHSVHYNFSLAAPRKRTKSTDLVFLFDQVRLVLGFAQRAYGTNSHCVSGAQLLCASTLVSLLRSLRSSQVHTGRTKDKQKLVFFYASGTLLCTAQRTYGAELTRPVS